VNHETLTIIQPSNPTNVFIQFKDLEQPPLELKIHTVMRKKMSYYTMPNELVKISTKKTHPKLK
jgi:hypothetical protein